MLIAAGATTWTAYKLVTGRGRWSRGGTDPSEAALTWMSAGGLVRPELWDVGTGLTGYAWHAPAPRAAVLLQHGYGEHAHRFVHQYNRLIPHLLEMGLSVYAFDMWGHGHSPGIRGLVDVDRAVEDHLAARRLLAGQSLPVFLFGHSLGGLVTATSVVRDQAGVHGVILSAPALLYEEPAAKRIVARIGAFAAPTMPAPAEKIEPARLYRDAEHDGMYTDDPLVYHGAIPMLVASTVVETSRRNWARYPEWRVPVLALHGTDDILTDPRGSERLIEAVAAPDKTLHLVEGGYHEVLNDTDRDASLQVVLQWLEQRIPAPAT
jgi:alpha-beta hydrolase superfamily lysophospholipase